MRGVRRKRGAKARVDEQKPDMRRERGTSSPLTAKSISIKHAERKSGDCARKAAELTSGDLAGRQKSAEGIVGPTSAKLVRHSRPKGGATDRPSRKRGAKARTRTRGKSSMDLRGDKRQQDPERDSSSTGPGEAQETGRRETESLRARHEHESPTDIVIRTMLVQRFRTAVYGPVRTVVWQGSAGDRRPYADGSHG